MTQRQLYHVSYLYFVLYNHHNNMQNNIITTYTRVMMTIELCVQCTFPEVKRGNIINKT